jgi:hypothetical protein
MPLGFRLTTPPYREDGENRFHCAHAYAFASLSGPRLIPLSSANGCEVDRLVEQFSAVRVLLAIIEDQSIVNLDKLFKVDRGAIESFWTAMSASSRRSEQRSANSGRSSILLSGMSCSRLGRCHPPLGRSRHRGTERLVRTALLGHLSLTDRFRVRRVNLSMDFMLDSPRGGPRDRFSDCHKVNPDWRFGIVKDFTRMD